MRQATLHLNNRHRQELLDVLDDNKRISLLFEDDDYDHYPENRLPRPSEDDIRQA